MLDQETKQYFDEQFGATERRFTAALDERFGELLTAVKSGFDAHDARFDEIDRRFDAVDARLAAIESDLAHLKSRMSAVEQELIVLSASMVTKQYLDAKLEALLSQPPISKIDGMRRAIIAMMTILERNNLLPSDQRATFEMLIT